MRTNLIFATVIALAVFAVGHASIHASETNTVTRIGIYDSRAVAFAWFWSDKHQKELRKTVQSARSAEKAGDTNHFEKLRATIRQQQDQMHREGFSTAPATEAMTELKARLPRIEKSENVTDIVSKWDEAGLKKYAGAEKVDVTDTLVREFITPTEKQQTTIISLEKSKPLSLEECDELIRKGKI